MRRLLSSLIPLLVAVACSSETEPVPVIEQEDRPVVRGETLSLALSFEATLDAAPGLSDTALRRLIQTQLLHAVGPLRHAGSEPDLQHTELSLSAPEPLSSGKSRTRYRALLPVEWNTVTAPGPSVRLVLPPEVSFEALSRFARLHAADCSHTSPDRFEPGRFWSDFSHEKPGCLPAAGAGDALRIDAMLTEQSRVPITASHAEHHEVWEDGLLELVAVFEGTAGSRSNYDAWVGQAAALLVTAGSTGLEDMATSATTRELRAQLPSGGRVIVHAMLVDDVRRGDQSFRIRFGALTPTTDVLLFHGRVDSGDSLRSLAGLSRFWPGQYLLLGLSTWDAFTFADDAFTQTRRRVNSDDVSGTRNMDIVIRVADGRSSGVPGFFAALLEHVLPVTDPPSLETVLADADAVFTGTEDNAFRPGDPVLVRESESGPGAGPISAFTELEETRLISWKEEWRLESPVLAPGRYRLELTGDGDADLYVRREKAATRSEYDCRSIGFGTAELCVIEIVRPMALHVLVHGYRNDTTATLGLSRSLSGSRG